MPITIGRIEGLDRSRPWGCWIISIALRTGDVLALSDLVAMLEELMPDKNPVDRHAELLDVQLLDVLATVESVLRHGREIQREALRARGVPSPVTDLQRRTAAAAIRDRVDQMKSDCMGLCRVVEDLHVCAVDFERVTAT